MIFRTILKCAVPYCLLSAAVVITTGCHTGPVHVDPLQDTVDYWDYKRRVRYYESRGMNEKEAQRNAYEDQFFYNASERQ